MEKALLDQTTVSEALHFNSARNQFETAIRLVMLACAAFSILVTVGIVFILLETAFEFFTHETFEKISALTKAVRQLGEQANLDSSTLNELISRSVDDREVTIRRLAEGTGSFTGLGVEPEVLQQAYEVQLESVSWWDTITTALSRFFLDTRWTPLFGSKRFGVWPLVNGTFLIASVAMCVAIPLGLLTALYLGIYAPRNLASILRPMVEVLAGIPTVVYGFFALSYITPVIQLIFPQTPIFNVLSAGLMMGVMITPTVGSISLDSINAVPQALHNGAYALGATKMEVALKVVFPAAISGIAASIILGISRAVGETMIVTVAAGQQPVSYGDGFFGVLGSIVNPLQSMATMTAYIAQVSLGDSPFGSIQYVTLFAVGMLLFGITLSLNMISRVISSRIRNVYE